MNEQDPIPGEHDSAEVAPDSDVSAILALEARGTVLGIDHPVWREKARLSELDPDLLADVVATLLHDPYKLDEASDRFVHMEPKVDECIIVLPVMSMDRSIEPPSLDTDETRRALGEAAAAAAALRLDR